MNKVRRVLLFSLGLALVALISLSGAGAVADPNASASITAAGGSSEHNGEDELSCSCACSPLAGSWIASLTPKEEEKTAKPTGGKDTKDSVQADSLSKKVKPLLKTFKFAPVNDKCDKFVVNAQTIARPQRVIRAFPEVTDLTEFVGIACKGEEDKVNFTAISYGIERGKEEDKTVFIAVLSGTIELPKEDGKDGDCSKCKCCKEGCKDSKCSCKTGDYSTNKDHPGKCSCCSKNGCKYSDCECKTGKYGTDDGKDKDRQECEEPKELFAELTVAYFDAEQDEDGDGFPDAREEPLICLAFKAEFKRVELQPQCKPSETPK